MSLVDNPQHRHNALMRLTNLRLIVQDVQTEISIAVADQPPLAIHQLLVLADSHLELALAELDLAGAAIRAI